MNKLLLKQIYHIYKRQGAIALYRYITVSFKYLFLDRYLRGSFSQKGEDLLIDKYFKHKKNGFYIDVGACHPKRFNNTKFFYDKGWQGINIEPNPSRILLFDKERRRDINLNLGIGRKSRKATFYIFESEGLSTFSKGEMESLLKLGYKLKGKRQVMTQKLNQIMKKYVKSEIDFLTIDTEGMEIEVLSSNDWQKYRPKLLCIETIDFVDLLISDKDDNSHKRNITKYLIKKGYREYFSNGLNTIYEDIWKKEVD